MPKQKSSPLKRAARYAKVSASMAGFGARAAGQKLGLSVDRQKQAERLRAALGGLKGPLMKVAQILSTIPDLVPPEYAAELAQLQADAPPMGWNFVRRRMAAELGADWEKKFKSFDRQACAAASLGQVHKAVAHNGQALACKLQYPDMESTVEADLRQLKFVMAIFERYDRAVSTTKVQQEIAERLHEELDYVREAKHMRLYGLMHKNSATVHIPEPLEEFSTERLLTMTWLSGDRLADIAGKASLKIRNAVAMNMFRAWYTPFYSYGVIHGDPHLGNYTVRKDQSINLLDYGCIRVFKPDLVQGVITLYEALRDGQEERAVEAYKEWGFKNPSKKLVETLNIWAKFIYAPLLEDKTRPIDETNTGLYGRETANKVHAELRKLGGVTVPREFVFMDRAAIGLGSVFLRLNAEINWYRMFHDLIAGFDVKTLANRQVTALKSCGL
ncbi:MAG: AarF/ABC1/UbiB kinase family protein, partial [Alphaproteobacteria bacterium]|nr:AarF/ABC1/UbiB kinase family protein [Alphaproteobacteria bacterium]